MLGILRMSSSTERNPKNTVGARVKLARLALQPPLTQDRLAGRLAAKGVALDRVSVTKIEGGSRRVYDFEVAALSQVLQVDARWLLCLQEDGGPAVIGRRRR